MYTITRRQVFSENSFLWEVQAPDIAAAAQPGHFVMLRLHENGERIPLTVADFDRDRGTVTVVVQALAKPRARCATHTSTVAALRILSGRSVCRSTSGKSVMWC